MRAETHKAYVTENNRLKNTIIALEKYISDYSHLYESGADDWARSVLYHHNTKRIQDLQFAKSSPYFMRVDAREKTGNHECFYIGYQGLNLGEYEVFDWRAPVGSLIAAKSVGDYSIITADGIKKYQLFLKRRFEIKDQKLLQIIDEVISHLNEKGQLVSNVDQQGYLLENLYTRGDTRLQDIVKTIQFEQDQLIRYPYDTTIVINGVAGSGKTSIAVHRISVLLYQNPEVLNPNRTILFCPNRFFLEYIKDLLPFLGGKDVIQTTFIDWVLKILKLDGFHVVDSAVEIFTNPEESREKKILRWKRSKLKNELRFKQLLENFVKYQKKQIKVPSDGFTYENVGALNLNFFIQRNELVGVINKNQNLNIPYNAYRDYILNDFYHFLEVKYDGIIWGKINEIKKAIKNLSMQKEQGDEEVEKIKNLNIEWKALQNRAFAIKPNKKNTIQIVNGAFRDDFQKLWPHMDAYHSYYELICDQKLMSKCNQQVFDEEEIKEILTEKPPEGLIENEDLAGIYYLQQLIYPPNIEKFDHIAVDEAQDFSIAQLEIIKSLSRNKSFTIVGDISQGINSHRGLDHWDELKQVFNREYDLQIKDISICYRSTKEITEFNNAILKRMRPERQDFPIPFNRQGPKPIIYKRSDWESVMEKTAEEIKGIKEKYKYKNIALITKNVQTCKDTIKYLKKMRHPINFGLEDILEEKKYPGGLIAIPVNMVKGIEFEAVVVINVDEETYSMDTPYDGRLLYVATTRALHYLSLIYSGRISRYLANLFYSANFR